MGSASLRIVTHFNRRMNSQSLGLSLLFLLLIGFHPSAEATLVNYTGTIEIQDDGGFAEFVIGDEFDFSLTIDHSSQDGNSVATFGFFPSGTVTGVSFTRDSGNTGNWDPTGGTFNAGTLTTNTGLSTHLLSTFNSPSSVFPTAGGFPFVSAQTTFSVPMASSPISDTGVMGQTLESQLGGLFDPADFIAGRNFFFSFDDGNGEPFARGSVTDFDMSIIPVPAAAWLFASALGMLGWIRSRAR